jgi:hypothetical protein
MNWLLRRHRVLLVLLEPHSQYVHPKHPPDKQNRDDAARDVNDPIASGFRLPKIEHAAIVAGPA